MKVSGKSSVLPLVLMVRGVALVEANVVVLVPAVSVMPVESVRSPKMVRAALSNVPEKPVKFRLRKCPDTLTEVPEVILKLIEFGSPAVVDVVTSDVAAGEILTTGVPVIVKPEDVDDHPEDPVTVIDPLVPKSIPLLRLPIAENLVQR